MTCLKNSLLAKTLNPEEKVDWKTRRKKVLCNEEYNGSYEVTGTALFQSSFLRRKKSLSFLHLHKIVLNSVKLCFLKTIAVMLTLWKIWSLLGFCISI